MSERSTADLAIEAALKVVDEYESLASMDNQYPPRWVDEIRAAIDATGWCPPDCSHDWSSPFDQGGNYPWHECHWCGKQENL